MRLFVPALLCNHQFRQLSKIFWWWLHCFVRKYFMNKLFWLPVKNVGNHQQIVINNSSIVVSMFPNCKQMNVVSNFQYFHWTKSIMILVHSVYSYKSIIKNSPSLNIFPEIEVNVLFKQLFAEIYCFINGSLGVTYIFIELNMLLQHWTVLFRFQGLFNGQPGSQ